MVGREIALDAFSRKKKRSTSNFQFSAFDVGR
jgi:hypothetical protein